MTFALESILIGYSFRLIALNFLGSYRVFATKTVASISSVSNGMILLSIDRVENPAELNLGNGIYVCSGPDEQRRQENYNCPGPEVYL
jgi:hypothetical protein